jgi:hypothetical protein
VAKALAATKAITDLGSMAPPPSRDCIGKWAQLRSCQSDANACFIVRDANGQALAYVYFEGEPGRARGGEAPHPDVALAYATPS